MIKMRHRVGALLGLVCPLRFVAAFVTTVAVLLNTAYAQMQTPGQFAVSQTGAATYTVPIRIPPGIAGIEPKLELKYSNQAGNGLLGVGWSLGGLSSITVCPQTKGQDGPNAYPGKTFYTTPNVRFCMDGQRLVPVPLPAVTGLESGAAGASGADQTYYRTELESFQLIQSVGATNGLPTYFKVVDRQGRTLEYGNTTDSVAVNSSGVSREWKLDKVTDVSGNYMTFTYSAPDATTGQSYPTTIKYTANDKASQAALNTISFSYNLDANGKPTRPDHVFAHFPGGTVNLTARLASISVKSSSSMVRQYSLTYDQGPYTTNSRLKQIQECGSDLVTCLPALTFGWDNYWSSYSSNGPVFTYLSNTGKFGSSDQWLVGDIDNNGTNNFLQIYDNGSGQAVVKSYEPGSSSPRIWATNAGQFSASSKFSLADINGDGLLDLVNALVKRDASNWQALGFFNSAASTFGVTQPSDVSYTCGSTACPSASWIYLPASDFNADGYADLALVNVLQDSSLPPNSDVGANSLKFYGQATANNNIVPTYAGMKLYSVVSGTASNLGVLRGDFTGDSVDDFLVYAVLKGTSWSFDIIDGAASVPQSYYPQNYLVSASGAKIFGAGGDKLVGTASLYLSDNGGVLWLAADVSGDGVSDIVKVFNDNGALSINALINNGDGTFKSSSPWGSSLGTISANDQFFVADVNGDGRADIVHFFVVSGKVSIDYIISDGVSFSRLVHQCVQCDNFLASDHFGVMADDTGTPIPYRIFYTASNVYVNIYPNTQGGGDIIGKFNSPTVKLVSYINSQSQSAGYSRSQNFQYPRQPMTRPIHVVDFVGVYDAAGLGYQLEYSYDSAAMELGTGRGFLGFNWVQVTNSATGLITRTTYRQDFPFIGQVAKVERGSSASTWAGLGVTNYSYTCVDFVNAAAATCSVAPGKHYFIYPSEIKSMGNFDLTATVGVGARLPGQDVTQAYDNWGNLTQSVTTMLDSTGAVTDFSKTTNNVYAPARVSNWQFNKLLRSTVTATGH